MLIKDVASDLLTPTTASPTTASTVLRYARAVIADPERWTRGALAVDQWGRSVETFDPAASKFCALGALDHVRPSQEEESGRFDVRFDVAFERADVYLHEAATQLFCTTVAGVNDYFGYQAALRVFDRAIELAERE
jgi:hypothetical protein